MKTSVTQVSRESVSLINNDTMFGYQHTCTAYLYHRRTQWRVLMLTDMFWT